MIFKLSLSVCVWCAYTCPCVCVYTSEDSLRWPLSSPLFETKGLMAAMHTRLSGHELPGILLPLSLISPQGSWDLQRHVGHVCLYMASWCPNSSPQAHTAGTLPTGLSPQPSSIKLKCRWLFFPDLYLSWVTSMWAVLCEQQVNDSIGRCIWGVSCRRIKGGAHC